MVVSKEVILDILGVSRFIVENDGRELNTGAAPENSRKYTTTIKPKITEFEKKYGNTPHRILSHYLDNYLSSRHLDNLFACESLHFYHDRVVHACTQACIYRRSEFSAHESDTDISRFPQLFVSIGEHETGIFGMEFGFRFGQNVQETSFVKLPSEAIAHNLVSLIKKKAFRNPGDVATSEDLLKIWSPGIKFVRFLTGNKLPDSIEDKIADLMDKLLPLFKSQSQVECGEVPSDELEFDEGSDRVYGHVSAGELSDEEDLEVTVAHDLQSIRIEECSLEEMKNSGYSNYYERDPKLRYAALAHHGRTCKVCGFNFEAHYGERGRDFIEVHHMKPVFPSRNMSVQPETDMTVVCSNCHRMIHRYHNHVMSVDELKKILRK
jgi:hypothetical protein